jgi:NitT/TauT family transport system substrate-binding protein
MLLSGGYPLSFPTVKTGRAIATLAAFSCLLPAYGRAAEDATPVFTLAWSIYPGNNPYPYMESSGILKKWADRYHLEIKLQRLDYTAAIGAFAARKVEACVMSNLDVIEVAATSGVDATVIYVNDSSNGNDVVLARNGIELKNLSNKKVLLIEKSVSYYLLERAIALRGVESQIPTLKLINASDGITARFFKDPAIDLAVTWKPIDSKIAAGAKTKELFNSSQIPGEVIHFLAVRTEVLNRADGSGDRFAKALTGAWYEVMSQLLAPAGLTELLGSMASASQNSVESLKEQISTTQFYNAPRTALNFANGGPTKENMRAVRQFCFNHKLLGDAQSPEDVAIEYPDQSVQGKPDHVRLHLQKKYMLLASERML